MPLEQVWGNTVYVCISLYLSICYPMLPNVLVQLLGKNLQLIQWVYELFFQFSYKAKTTIGLATGRVWDGPLLPHSRSNHINLFPIPVPNPRRGRLISPIPVYKRVDNTIPVLKVFSGQDGIGRGGFRYCNYLIRCNVDWPINISREPIIVSSEVHL